MAIILSFIPSFSSSSGLSSYPLIRGIFLSVPKFQKVCALEKILSNLMQGIISYCPNYHCYYLWELVLTKTRERHSVSGSAYNLLRKMLHYKDYQGDCLCSVERKRHKTYLFLPQTEDDLKQRKISSPKPHPETLKWYVVR